MKRFHENERFGAQKCALQIVHIVKKAAIGQKSVIFPLTAGFWCGIVFTNGNVTFHNVLYSWTQVGDPVRKRNTVHRWGE